MFAFLKPCLQLLPTKHKNQRCLYTLIISEALSFNWWERTLPVQKGQEAFSAWIVLQMRLGSLFGVKSTKTPGTRLYEPLKLSVGGVCKRCLIWLRWFSEDRAGQMMNWRNFQKTQMAKVCLILEMWCLRVLCIPTGTLLKKIYKKFGHESEYLFKWEWNR